MHYKKDLIYLSTHDKMRCKKKFVFCHVVFYFRIFASATTTIMLLLSRMKFWKEIRPTSTDFCRCNCTCSTLDRTRSPIELTSCESCSTVSLKQLSATPSTSSDRWTPSCPCVAMASRQASNCCCSFFYNKMQTLNQLSPSTQHLFS